MNKNRQLEISGNVCQQFLDWKCHSNCACAFTIQSWFSLWTYSIYQIPSFDLLKFSMLFQMIYRDPNPLNSFKNKLIKFRIFWSNWPEANCLFPVVCKWTGLPLYCHNFNYEKFLLCITWNDCSPCPCVCVCTLVQYISGPNPYKI